jgi:hypothetical protein
MSGLELVARLNDALAWPLAALIAVIVLRRSIAELIARRPPRRVKTGTFEVEWDRLVAETEKEVEPEISAPGTERERITNVADELSRPQPRKTQFLLCMKHTPPLNASFVRSSPRRQVT